MHININLSELYEFKPTITADEINEYKFQRKKRFVNTYQCALDGFVRHYIQPNCMITIQLHKSEKTSNINVFEERIHYIMKSLEKTLLGAIGIVNTIPLLSFTKTAMIKQHLVEVIPAHLQNNG